MFLLKKLKESNQLTIEIYLYGTSKNLVNDKEKIECNNIIK